MRTLRAAAFALLCSGVMIVVAVPADGRSRADEVRARELFRRAEVHFNLQEFEKALGLYAQAYKLKPLPGFLFNIGQCQRYLGKLEEALFSYRIYLQRVSHPPNRVQVERLIEITEMELTKRREQPATRPTVSQPGEGIAGDDRPLFEEPATLPVDDDPGAGGDRQDRPSRLRSAVLWTGAGLSAALLITGGITAALARSHSNEYNDPDTAIDRREELKDPGEALGNTAYITLGLGGACAVATILYYFLGKRRNRSTVSALPLPGGAGLTIRGEL
jgi:hypothetical protein